MTLSRFAAISVASLWVIGCGGESNLSTPQGSSRLGSSTAALSSGVTTIATFNRFTEGLAVDRNGNFYVGFYYRGVIHKVAADGTQSTFATLPVGTLGGGLVGLGVDEDGDVYACLASYDSNQGIWKVSADGSQQQQIAALDPAGFPNGLAIDAHSIFVTDSTLGQVWRISRDTLAVEVFSKGPLLAPPDPLGDRVGSFGANGIQIDDGALWVTNTSKGLIARIDLDARGSHDAQLWLQSDQLIGADGNAFDEDHNQYIANDGLEDVSTANTIMKVYPNKQFEVLFPQNAGLDFPASVAFGQSSDSRRDLFWTNGGFNFGIKSLMEGNVGEKGVRLPVRNTR